MADFAELSEQIKSFDISDVDWERVGVWPLAARLFLFIVAAALIIGATYFLFVKDQLVQLDTAEKKEMALRTEFEKKAFEAANLESYRQQMVEMKESLDALLKRLPEETEMPGLLEDIDEKATVSRLSIEKLEMQSARTTEFYVETPIDIEVTGGYHEFGSFVSGVAGMPRIVTLHNFTIKRKKDSRNMLSMAILAKTYRYKREDEE